MVILGCWLWKDIFLNAGTVDTEMFDWKMACWYFSLNLLFFSVVVLRQQVRMPSHKQATVVKSEIWFVSWRSITLSFFRLANNLMGWRRVLGNKEAVHDWPGFFFMDQHILYFNFLWWKTIGPEYMGSPGPVVNDVWNEKSSGAWLCKHGHARPFRAILSLNKAERSRIFKAKRTALDK